MQYRRMRRGLDEVGRDNDELLARIISGSPIPPLPRMRRECFPFAVARFSSEFERSEQVRVTVPDSEEVRTREHDM